MSEIDKDVVEYIEHLVNAKPEMTKEEFKKDLNEVIGRVPSLKEYNLFFRKKEEKEKSGLNNPQSKERETSFKFQMLVSKPSFVTTIPRFVGHSSEETSSEKSDKKEVVDESRKKKLTELVENLNDSIPSLKEISSLTKDSVDLAMYCLEKGLFGTQSSDNKNNLLRFYSLGSDLTVVEEAFNILDSVIAQGKRVGNELVKCNFFKNLFDSVIKWLGNMTAPSDYSPLQRLILTRTTKCIKSLKVSDSETFLLNGGLSFFIHILRIHMLSYCESASSSSECTSPYGDLSFTLINSCVYWIVWEMGWSLLYDTENMSMKFRGIVASFISFNVYDLIFSFFQKCTASANTNLEKRNDGILSAVLIAFLHKSIDLPTKYLGIFPALRIALDQSPESCTRMMCAQAALVFTSVEKNHAYVHQAHLGQSLFALFTKPTSPGLEVEFCLTAFVNMTTTKSADARNALMNAQAFACLKNMLDKMSVYQEGVHLISKGVLLKNAIVIEKIFLLLGNTLIANPAPLKLLVDAKLLLHVLDYLAGEDGGANKRQEAGNILRQQKAALFALHSLTVHPNEHVFSLLAFLLLPKLRAIFGITSVAAASSLVAHTSKSSSSSNSDESGGGSNSGCVVIISTGCNNGSGGSNSTSSSTTSTAIPPSATTATTATTTATTAAAANPNATTATTNTNTNTKTTTTAATTAAADISNAGGALAGVCGCARRRDGCFNVGSEDGSGRRGGGREQ